jgi:DNA replication protein DnaC
MDNRKEQTEAFCRQFKITGMANSLTETVARAEKQNQGYMDFIHQLLNEESGHRIRNEVIRRRKAANLPLKCDLGQYDATVDNGLGLTRINQLRELNWLDQGFNIMLMGPSGTGKTLLAAGLCTDAIDKGYKAYFKTMEELVTMLKTREMIRSAQTEYRRLTKADLIIIDDIMLFPVEKKAAVDLFNFINAIYEQTCIIITTNKMAADWAKMLDDEVLATALLDRLLFRCEIINLSGKSYRMENRKSFFDPNN